MSGFGVRLENSHRVLPDNPKNSNFCFGGLFLDASTVPSSIINTISAEVCGHGRPVSWRRKRGDFLCLSLSVKGKDGVINNSTECVGGSGGNESKEAVGGAAVKAGKRVKVRLRGRGRSTPPSICGPGLWLPWFQVQHCANDCSLIRTCVAPLERLKLEYIVRGEKRNLYELVNRIATTQGLRGFWKGNFVNILRTAPFKAINFCAYDTYRKQLLKLSGDEETTNSVRFIAGAAAGITATVLCLPLDTDGRWDDTNPDPGAPGGEALGGVIGAFQHVVRHEGFLSLYKGLLPSILSMAPSGAVFYGVYDMLKSAYLHSPEGRKRIQNLKQQDQELNALEQLELGPMRTLLHGAIAGACAEAATYPFEVLRRQLQLQDGASKLSALATCVKIVERGGVPALYAGLIPSLLQVLPSASISFFVYEFMKIVLKQDEGIIITTILVLFLFILMYVDMYNNTFLNPGSLNLLHEKPMLFMTFLVSALFCIFALAVSLPG
ncbi:UNVERIFIED_CONTAM: putative mitochondrial adenine nucleotide transporter BTL3 [Sesamum latifolium]|uniref:Mitochondrial adenine nucleotide transporter BTL3 n=1 Tax=Sesamum latifolium TaxID=2727402 RepID=A0AAW2VT65_9LAMI